MFLLVFLVNFLISFVSAFDCQLYAIDQSSVDTKFIQINNDGSSKSILNLGRSVFSTTIGSNNVNNRNYLGTYHTFDSLGIPYFYLLNIDIKTKSVSYNTSLNEKNKSGSFYQVAVASDDEIIGIRDRFGTLALEVARINASTGVMKTIGVYPVGTFSIVMIYASKRRIYYNVIDSTLYGIHIDTGKLLVNATIPNDIVYGLDYDEQKDRLIAVIYTNTGGKEGFILTEAKVNSHQEIRFNPIGNAKVDFNEFYMASTSTIDTSQRLWISSWIHHDKETATLMIFHLDTGEIVQTLQTNLKQTDNFVCMNK